MHMYMYMYMCVGGEPCTALLLATLSLALLRSSAPPQVVLVFAVLGLGYMILAQRKTAQKMLVLEDVLRKGGSPGGSPGGYLPSGAKPEVFEVRPRAQREAEESLRMRNGTERNRGGVTASEVQTAAEESEGVRALASGACSAAGVCAACDV